MDRFYKRRNEFAKKEINFLKLFSISSKIIILSLFLVNIFLIFKTTKNEVYGEEILINASGYIVIDANNSTIFAGEDIDKKLPMASTTKIMTAIIAIENLDLNKYIKINKNAIGVEGSSIYLKGDVEYKIEDLIYGLMLRSGNDAAEALAYETAGSIEDFAKMMNDKVKELGLVNTNFVNPHGLHDDNHYTSAYDLAMISAYAMKNPVFKQIVSSQKHIVENDENNIFYNKNKLLLAYEGANGIKTGYTTVSGRCLVSAAEKGGAQIIAVVLGCPDMWRASMELLDYAFSKFDCKKIINKNIPIYSDETISLATFDDVYVSFIKNKRNNINIKLSIDETLIAPIDKNSRVGCIDIYVDNCLLFSKKIYTIKAINNSEDIDRLKNLVIDTKYGEIK